MNDLTDLKIWLASFIRPIVFDAIKDAKSPEPIPKLEANEPISPEELCKRLGISKPTAWAWEKKGIIKGYHLGNKKYYIWGEVIADMTKKRGVSA